MSFNESLKEEVRRKAAFRCCRCHEIGIDVHHIHPESEGGKDIFENAAPLCPNCHDNFGDNPQKRKVITQMRDWWYEVVQENYHEVPQAVRALSGLMVELKRDGELRTDQIASIQAKLNELRVISEVKIGDTASETCSKVEGMISATRLSENVYSNVKCNKCGTIIGLLVGANSCPYCHQPLQ